MAHIIDVNVTLLTEAIYSSASIRQLPKPKYWVFLQLCNICGYVMWSQSSQSTTIVATPTTIVAKKHNCRNANHNCRNSAQPQLSQRQSQMSQFFISYVQWEGQKLMRRMFVWNKKFDVLPTWWDCIIVLKLCDNAELQRVAKCRPSFLTWNWNLIARSLRLSPLNYFLTESRSCPLTTLEGQLCSDFLKILCNQTCCSKEKRKMDVLTTILACYIMA